MKPVKRTFLRWLVYGLVIWRRFQQAGGVDSAASLAYVTLLSIVPLFAYVISVLSLTHWFEAWMDQVADFLVQLLTPDSLARVEALIRTLSLEAVKLKGPSLVGLLITVLFLLDKVYRKIAGIWLEVPRGKLWVRVLHYLGVSIFGPILIVLSLWVSGVLGALSLLDFGWLNGVKLEALKLVPFVLTMIGFYLLYRYAPPAPIAPKAAWLGAFLATVGLQLLKAGFALYVQYASYKVFYGALAAIPLFLVWLYLLWSIVLLVATVVWFVDKRLKIGRFSTKVKLTEGRPS